MAKRKRIREYIDYDLWRKNGAEMGKMHRFGLRLLRTIVLVIRSFGSKSLSVRADHLTYSLLFAIVPIMAMVLAVSKGFGFSEVIEQQLLKTPVGQSEFMPMVMEIVHRYLDTSAGASIVLVSALCYAVSLAVRSFRK